MHRVLSIENDLHEGQNVHLYTRRSVSAIKTCHLKGWFPKVINCDPVALPYLLSARKQADIDL